MDLKVIKLVSGETVLATVEPVTDASEPLVRLCNPISIRPTPNGATLGSWPEFSDPHQYVDIKPQHIVAVANITTATTIINAYAETVGGITTPAKPELIVP